jgi:hypothetical protein
MVCVLLVLSSLAACQAYDCYFSRCRFVSYSSNDVCDKDCASEICGFDQEDVPSTSPALVRYMASECIYECLKVCSVSLLSNGKCDSKCNIKECGFDAGDCGYCAAGCKVQTGFKSMLGNGKCDAKCNTKECYNDLLDCLKAPLGECTVALLGNEVCDLECNSFINVFDNYRCVRCT